MLRPCERELHIYAHLYTNAFMLCTQPALSCIFFNKSAWSLPLRHQPFANYLNCAILNTQCSAAWRMAIKIIMHNAQFCMLTLLKCEVRGRISNILCVSRTKCEILHLALTFRHASLIANLRVWRFATMTQNF